MRRARRLTKTFLGFSVIGYLLTAIAVLLVPLAMTAEGRFTVFGYIAGGLFWFGLLFGLLFFLFAWKVAHNESTYQKIRSWYRIGAFGFFRNRPAIITDVLMIISLLLIIAGNTIWHFQDLLMTILLFFFVLSFFLHFVFNGRVFIYTQHKGRKRKNDLSIQRKELNENEN
ncbi:MAG: hypothetical protein J6P72_11035 [Firmicutes bacterium]|nr:hypothetical protein [Bacillota bacterium]